MFQSINSFKRVEINKELMCVFTYECIARLIHCHRNTGQSDFTYCAPCSNKDRIYGIKTAIAMSKTILCNCLFGCQGVRCPHIFRSKKRNIAVPIRSFTGFGCTTTENLNYFCKPNFCICPIIEIEKQRGCLLL